MTVASSQADSISSLFATHQAVIISHGDRATSWVIGRSLDTGEDLFVFPPDNDSFAVIDVPLGMVVNTECRRPCRKPGRIKETTTALDLLLQPSPVKDFFEAQPERGHVQESKQSTGKRLCNSSPQDTPSREKKLSEIIEEHGFEGRYAASKALSRCIDICIEYNLV